MKTVAKAQPSALGVIANALFRPNEEPKYLCYFFYIRLKGLGFYIKYSQIVCASTICKALAESIFAICGRSSTNDETEETFEPINKGCGVILGNCVQPEQSQRFGGYSDFTISTIYSLERASDQSLQRPQFSDGPLRITYKKKRIKICFVSR